MDLEFLNYITVTVLLKNMMKIKKRHCDNAVSITSIIKRIVGEVLILLLLLSKNKSTRCFEIIIVQSQFVSKYKMLSQNSVIYKLI